VYLDKRVALKKSDASSRSTDNGHYAIVIVWVLTSDGWLDFYAWMG